MAYYYIYSKKLDEDELPDEIKSFFKGEIDLDLNKTYKIMDLVQGYRKDLEHSLNNATEISIAEIVVALGKQALLNKINFQDTSIERLSTLLRLAIIHGHSEVVNYFLKQKKIQQHIIDLINTGYCPYINTAISDASAGDDSLYTNYILKNEHDPEKNKHAAVVHHLLSYAPIFSYAERVFFRVGLNPKTWPIVVRDQTMILTFISRKLAYLRNHDISNDFSENEISLCFYMMRHLVRHDYDVSTAEEDIRYLFTIPAVKTLAQHRKHELLEVASKHSNHKAISILNETFPMLNANESCSRAQPTLNDVSNHTNVSPPAAATDSTSSSSNTSPAASSHNIPPIMTSSSTAPSSASLAPISTVTTAAPASSSNTAIAQSTAPSTIPENIPFILNLRKQLEKQFRETHLDIDNYSHLTLALQAAQDLENTLFKAVSDFHQRRGLCWYKDNHQYFINISLNEQEKFLQKKIPNQDDAKRCHQLLLLHAKIIAITSQYTQAYSKLITQEMSSTSQYTQAYSNLITQKISSAEFNWSEYKNALKTAVHETLSNNKMDKYTKLEKVGILLLNIIGFIFSPIKMYKTGTFFYSSSGKPKEAVEEVLNAVEQQVSPPAPAA